MMKILLWTASFWPNVGGLETLCLSLAKGLRERGHDCRVITNKVSQSSPNFEVHNSVPIYRFEFDDGRGEIEIKLISLIIRELKSLFEAFQPDVVNFHYLYGRHLFFYDFLYRTFSFPILTTLHGIFGEEDLFRMINIYNLVFKKSARINCVSDALVEQLLSGLPQLRPITRRIYNGVSASPVAPVSLSFDPPKILCFGRLTEEKGFDVCVGAMQLVLQKIPQAKLIVSGKGTEIYVLNKIVQALKIQESVIFTGLTPYHKIFDLINTATLVVVPSRYESFGLSAVEAMQMGRPVIASKVGGLQEIVQHEKTGWLIPKNNISVLAQTIVSALSNPKRLIAMGENAKQHVQENFSVQQLVDNYESAFAEIIGERIENSVLG